MSKCQRSRSQGQKVQNVATRQPCGAVSLRCDAAQGDGVAQPAWVMHSIECPNLVTSWWWRRLWLMLTKDEMGCCCLNLRTRTAVIYCGLSVTTGRIREHATLRRILIPWSHIYSSTTFSLPTQQNDRKSTAQHPSRRSSRTPAPQLNHGWARQPDRHVRRNTTGPNAVGRKPLWRPLVNCCPNRQQRHRQTSLHGTWRLALFWHLEGGVEWPEPRRIAASLPLSLLSFTDKTLQRR